MVPIPVRTEEALLHWTEIDTLVSPERTFGFDLLRMPLKYAFGLQEEACHRFTLLLNSKKPKYSRSQ
jgi:hypothetical protein